MKRRDARMPPLKQQVVGKGSFKGAGDFSESRKKEITAAVKGKGKGKGNGKIENNKDLDRYVGNKINENVNKVGNNANKVVGGAIDKGAKYFIDRGGDKNVINYGKKIIGGAAKDLIREGVGGAKQFIHQGRKNFGERVKEGFNEFGKRARGWFDSVGERFKRRR